MSDRSVAPRRARPVLGDPTYVSPRYQSKFWARLMFAALILALVGGIGVVGGVYYLLHRAQSTSSQRIVFHVGSGDTVTTVAERLQSEGVIDNTLLFRFDARLHGLANKLKVGDFFLRRNMSIDQTIAALQIYHWKHVKITVPEGLRSEQIAAILQRHGINGAAFLKQVKHPTFHLPILKGRPRRAGLEGYLFPNTYEVPPHYGARAFAELMVKTLQQQFTPGMRAAARKRGRSVYQTLILASIVEREARMPDERPTIASVYANRIRDRMGLFADPTVQYAVGHPGNWWPVLTTAQLRTPSPFNTYIHHGLPPGPIANPGIASIRAAVYPKHTQFLYFVAKGNGRHAFAKTYQQQLANQSKYQQ